MKEYSIGEVLRKRRLELGLTQAELCEGICESSTLSRIENGSQTPCRSKLIALLQRLGLPDEIYYSLSSGNDLKCATLQIQLRSCQVLHKFEEGLVKLSLFESLVSPKDRIAQQYILRVKTVFGYWENGQLLPYSYNEKLNMLFSALYLTVPHFDMQNIEQGLYSTDEIKVINQIALCYSDNGQREISISIYSQLMNYIQNHFCELNQSSTIIILVAYNYSRDLFSENRFQDAIEIANIGLQFSITSSRLTYLGNLLYILAYSFYNLDLPEKSLTYFQQAYTIYSITNDTKNIMLTQTALQELFNLTTQSISVPPAGIPTSCGTISEPFSPES